MKTFGDRLDPKNLIAESYRMDGLTLDECRSVFLDWALSLSDDVDAVAVLPELMARHSADDKDHPMTQVMQDGLQRMSGPKRRGGWRSRPRSEA